MGEPSSPPEGSIYSPSRESGSLWTVTGNEGKFLFVHVLLSAALPPIRLGRLIKGESAQDRKKINRGEHKLPLVCKQRERH